MSTSLSEKVNEHMSRAELQADPFEKVISQMTCQSFLGKPTVNHCIGCFHFHQNRIEWRSIKRLDDYIH